MNLRRAAAIAAILCLATSASHAAPSAGARALVGCYAQAIDGEASVRLREAGNHYVFESLSGAKGGIELFERPLPEAVEGNGIGAHLVTALLAEVPVIGLFKVREGAVIDGTPAESEYYFYAPQVGGFLFRRECPEA